MEFLLGSALAALLVTLATAKWLAVRRPAQSYRRQVALSAMSFPGLAVLIFVVVTAYTLAQPSSEPGGGAGMVVFALVFFLFYALMVGLTVGLVTALVAVRAFRAR